MVSRPRGCRNFRFLCQKYSAHAQEHQKEREDGKSHEMENSRQTDEGSLNRAQSAPLRVTTPSGLTLSQFPVGPRCTSVPLFKRRPKSKRASSSRATANPYQNIIEKRSYSNKNGSKPPMSVRICFSAKSATTPCPPSTSPADYGSDRSISSEDISINNITLSNKKFEPPNKEFEGNEYVHNVPEVASRKTKVQIVRADSVVKEGFLQKSPLMFDWKSKIRAKTTATPILKRRKGPKSSANCSSKVAESIDFNDVKQNETPTFKIHKYSYSTSPSKVNLQSDKKDRRICSPFLTSGSETKSTRYFVIVKENSEQLHLGAKQSERVVRAVRASSHEKAPLEKKQSMISGRDQGELLNARGRGNLKKDGDVQKIKPSEQKSSIKLSKDESRLQTSTQPYDPYATDEQLFLTVEQKIRRKRNVKISDILSGLDLLREKPNDTRHEHCSTQENPPLEIMGNNKYRPSKKDKSQKRRVISAECKIWNEENTDRSLLSNEQCNNKKRIKKVRFQSPFPAEDLDDGIRHSTESDVSLSEATNRLTTILKEKPPVQKQDSFSQLKMERLNGISSQYQYRTVVLSFKD